EISGLKNWVEENDAGVAFFSPLKHGLLLGRYQEPPLLGDGDHRSRIPGFRDPAQLDRFRDCRKAVEARFPSLPHPVLSCLTGVLLTDATSGCAILGLRQPHHVRAAALVGASLTQEDADWVRSLYRGEA
ncbi:MAG: hypothetical protein WBN62_10795, partial [Thermoanaerobaculia bacterium]